MPARGQREQFVHWRFEFGQSYGYLVNETRDLVYPFKILGKGAQGTPLTNRANCGQSGLDEGFDTVHRVDYPVRLVLAPGVASTGIAADCVADFAAAAFGRDHIGGSICADPGGAISAGQAAGLQKVGGRVGSRSE